MSEGEDQRAFVVARLADESWVTELPANGAPVVVGSGAEADVRLADRGVADRQLVLSWDGEKLVLESEADGTYLGGK